MLKEKITRALELSAQLNVIFQSMDIMADNSEALIKAEQIQQQRGSAIQDIFSSANQQELAYYNALLKQLLLVDKELQITSSDLKVKMSKQIVQQKRKTKATQAYIQK